VKPLLEELAAARDHYRTAYVHARQNLELNGRPFSEYDARMYAAKMVRDLGKREPEVIRLEYFAHVSVPEND
jgi:hypothetical protein